jgi:pimeloyl-ACP methyl ester carboxylesterase
MNRFRDCSGDIRNIAIIFLLAAALFFGIAAQAGAARLTTEEYTVSAGAPGIELFVRNKRPSGMTDYTAARTVLFVHGSTYPAEATFDLALDGYSWMDVIAARGFDVYLLDLRGYGRSTRPKEMDDAPAANAPLVTTEVALRDVSAVVAHILHRRRLPNLNLIGWSWGTTIAASYAIQNPDKVGHLVLYGAQWLGDGNVSGKLGAYRTVDRAQVRAQWLAGVPREEREELIPSGWFERWADAVFASDPVGAAQDPPVLRAPNGTVLDSQKYWRAGVPFYDPEQIVAPVLLIHGEWDHDTPGAMSRALFPKLKNASWRRLVVVGEATHMLMLEKNRQQLFEEVQLFLEREEAPKPAEALQVASSIAAEIAPASTSRPHGPEESASSELEKIGSPQPPPDVVETGQIADGGQGESAAQAEGSPPDSSEPATVPPAEPEPSQALTEPEADALTAGAAQAPAGSDAEAPAGSQAQAPAPPDAQASSDLEAQAPAEPEAQTSLALEAGGPAEPEVQGSSGPEAQAPIEPKAQTAAEPASQAPREAIAALLKRGEAFLALGDISAARLFYARAADGGSARAMTALGKTYDPAFIDRAKAVGVRPDPAVAADWYRKAMTLDDAEAAFCAERLTALGRE